MKLFSSILITLALSSLPALANDRTEFTGKGKPHFEAPIPAGAKLKIHVRSGEVRIVGSDDGKLAVDVKGDSSKIENLRYRLSSAEGVSDFHLSGGTGFFHNNEPVVTIHVPKNSELYVRVPAGDLSIEGVTGSKDIEIHAGDLTIAAGNPSDYSYVEASVSAGDISAAPFGEDHGGLFRSFHKSGPGKYTLYAHVGAGDLTLH